jgi:hypothetical protein
MFLLEDALDSALRHLVDILPLFLDTCVRPEW